MKLTLAEAAVGAGAVLEAPASMANAGALVARGYSIDSRTVAVGELFFAVRGERLDGHDFVAAAIQRGAVAAVVSRARVAALPDAALAAPLLIAEDPLIALQALAAHVRRQWGRRVIAVTGSAGKTTTKEAIAAALGAKFNVLKSQGNLNNTFGLPLQLLRLEAEHEVAVIEMGMNHSGEISALTRIAAPDWGVITNVGTAHIENFAEGQTGIARAKFELVGALPSNGVVFLNCGDPYVSQFGRDFPGRAVYFGSGHCADPQLLEATEDLAGLHLRFRAGEREGALTLRLLGAHNAANAMAGLAVALEAGVELDAAVKALESLTAGDKRGEVIEIGGATILNDCYNSNPEALRSMIRTLAARPAAGRRILVAGEMLEQGEHGPALHAACGRAAAEAGLDLVAGVGGNAEHLAAAACKGGVAALFLPNAEAAGRWLLQNLQAGDVVLVKGSRGVHLERAIEVVRNPARPVTPRTNIYVDGFNFFYGAAKDTPFKWVDIAKLCAAVLPGIDIGRIRYFTALVNPTPGDPSKRTRQEMYIRALETLPNLTVHKGHYLQSAVFMPLLNPPPPPASRQVEVLKMEEKGSDVNIATYMLVDAFRRDCDQLVVITNDSDLAETVRIINKELGIPVGIFNPHTTDTAARKTARTGKAAKAFPSIALRKVAKFVRDIRSDGPTCHMAVSQFPDTIAGAHGQVVRKPAGW
jgi:UDP-N-acetylmuramoyl-tripeptide--D-alanyl-D-alanine ligase